MAKKETKKEPARKIGTAASRRKHAVKVTDAPAVPVDQLVEDSSPTAYDDDIYSQNITEMDTVGYAKEKTVLYGANVSIFRNCASLVDGLVPVRRRILYTMYADTPRLLPTDDYHKVPEWYGTVAKYHPHGTQTLDHTFESIIKDWETNACLIDVSGNNGSLAGDSSAATRYLDARMSLYAYKCFFEEFDPDCVEMVDNYLQSTKEPVVLPAKYPNFLMGVGTGIAWGNSMALLPFNLAEAFELTKTLIKHPETTGVYLFPDSPRGYEIIDDGTIRDICNAGHGSIKCRAVMTKGVDLVEGYNYIEVSGYPEGTTQDSIESRISALIASKKILGIQDINDKSDITSTKMHIILKNGVDPDQMINQLYSLSSSKLVGHADLEFNFAERTGMYHAGLKDAILTWVERRIEYKQKYYKKRLTKLNEKKHQLEGTLKMLANKTAMRKAMDAMFDASDDASLNENLVKQFEVSSFQAKKIASLNMNTVSASRREALEKELKQIPKEINRITKILSSKKAMQDDIIAELDEGIELFGKPRRCRIISKNDISTNFEMKYRLLITATHIKKMMTGGRSLGMTAQDELVAYWSEVSENDKFIMITDNGRVYPFNLNKIDATDAAHRGTAIFDALGISKPIVKCIRISKEVEEDIDNYEIVFFTKNGIVKKSPLKEYLNAKAGAIGINLDGDGNDDSVCYIMTYRPNSDATNRLIYTKYGYGIAIDLNYVNTTSRVTRGIQHLVLSDDDEVCGVCDTDCEELCVITQNGYGKRCGYTNMFQATKRKDAMTKITSLNEGDSVFKIIPVKDNFDNLTVTIFLNDGSKIPVSLKEIPSTTRISKGSRLVALKKSDSIARIKLNEIF